MTGCWLLVLTRNGCAFWFFFPGSKCGCIPDRHSVPIGDINVLATGLHMHQIPGEDNDETELERCSLTLETPDTSVQLEVHSPAVRSTAF